MFENVPPFRGAGGQKGQQTTEMSNPSHIPASDPGNHLHIQHSHRLFHPLYYKTGISFGLTKPV